MRNKICFLFLSIPLVFACKEDEQRELQTDLPTEAAQFFSISKSMDESLFYALTPKNSYQETDTLPGLAAVIISEGGEKITIDFDSLASDSEQKYARTGKLILTYENELSLESVIQMTYENYTFEGHQLEGSRVFTKTSRDSYSETFEGLKQITSEDLTSVFSGEITHQVGMDNGDLLQIQSSGIITGVNAVGRDFELNFPEAKNKSMDCFQSEEILPQAGSETWIVARGGISRVTHSLTYEAVSDCEVEVFVILPDGKRLLLNP